MAVTDVNDNSPVFNPALYTISVLETAAYGPTVTLTKVTVSDMDLGANADVSVSIKSGNDEGKFSING